MPRPNGWYASSVCEAIVHRGRRLEYFTIAWNTLEGLIGVGAGLEQLFSWYVENRSWPHASSKVQGESK